MDRQGNKYTFLYASVMVIVVATILAFVAEALGPIQKQNEEEAKMIDILKSVSIESTTANVADKYEEYIGDKSYIVNYEGDRQDASPQAAFNVDLSKEVRKPLPERQYPVYECHLDNGEVKYILPVRGKGLWGPIWGYIALNQDKQTIFGATFDHKGETPGLGAEIANDAFQQQFKGKSIFDDEELVSVQVVKGGAPDDAPHSVDAISGGTITSQGLETMLMNYFNGYEAFLKK
ncbi:NADH:ubiquinone reductase (Na(+)-transporting) subunit C [Marinilabilia rubra]|uniref:Na(+)-translocating NADH-quinone reductase subunit C n=1 Tax=Marinilabilia rubra TaxID=2162893 RepID=A0A2U2BA73_9BACT|nr:NADH:ubiquinone reductase (Na(+)-transporting) subunit C [Marinilabilia rubra]PWD99936.1 NADH:ubiquinone reductase (Na(+)-transporting) subunit C [Marinilabilia rubra]